MAEAKRCDNCAKCEVEGFDPTEPMGVVSFKCKLTGYYVRPLGCCADHEPGDPWGLVDEGQAEAGL